MAETLSPPSQQLSHFNPESEESEFEAVLLPTQPQPPKQSQTSRSTSELTLAYALFCIISASYMATWIGLGTFITYFSQTYGPHFFILLNISFYLPGLPISIIQHNLDETCDSKYGTRTTFIFRITLSFLVIILTCILYPFANGYKYQTLALTLTLGTATWTVHGAVTALTACFPRRAVGFLQFGFQLPNLYAVMLVFALGFYGNSAADDDENVERYTQGRIEEFFFLTGGLICLGLVCVGVFFWLDVTRHVQRCYAIDLESFERSLSSDMLLDGVDFHSRTDSDSTRDDNDNDDNNGSNNEEENEDEDDLSRGLLLPRPSSTSPSPSTLTQSQSLTKASKAHQTFVLALIKTHRVVMFVTIFSSITSGACFSLVPSYSHVTGADSSDKNDADGTKVMELSQQLYFLRLFGDLLGRAFAIGLPRPLCLHTITGLVNLMYIRILLLLTFFAYIFLPPALHSFVLPRSDVFISVMVFLGSLQSGYSTVLTYEYALKVIGDECASSHNHMNMSVNSSMNMNMNMSANTQKGSKQSKSIGSRGLNMAFQYACFGACAVNGVIALINS